MAKTITIQPIINPALVIDLNIRDLVPGRIVFFINSLYSF